MKNRRFYAEYRYFSYYFYGIAKVFSVWHESGVFFG